MNPGAAGRCWAGLHQPSRPALPGDTAALQALLLDGSAARDSQLPCGVSFLRASSWPFPQASLKPGSSIAGPLRPGVLPGCGLGPSSEPPGEALNPFLPQPSSGYSLTLDNPQSPRDSGFVQTGTRAPACRPPPTPQPDLQGVQQRAAAAGTSWERLKWGPDSPSSSDSPCDAEGPVCPLALLPWANPQTQGRGTCARPRRLDGLVQRGRFFAGRSARPFPGGFGSRGRGFLSDLRAAS